MKDYHIIDLSITLFQKGHGGLFVMSRSSWGGRRVATFPLSVPGWFAGSAAAGLPARLGRFFEVKEYMAFLMRLPGGEGEAGLAEGSASPG